MPRRPRDDPNAEHLDRETIVRAALSLIDREGSRRFSLRALARDLDVANMSLYWHIDDRDTLIGLVLDEVIGSVELTPPGDQPLDALRSLCTAFATAFGNHPETVELFATVPITRIGPRSLAVFDHAIGLLHAAQVRPDRIPSVTAAIFEYLAGHLVGAVADARHDDARDIEALLATVSPDEMPHLRSLRQVFTERSFGSVEDGLDLILDGLNDPPRG